MKADQVFSGSIDWNTASVNAATSILNNSIGYLATITTPMEHNFLYRSFGYLSALIGGSDEGNEGKLSIRSMETEETNKNLTGTWVWVTKEKTTFWTTDQGCLSFCLWNYGEPNNAGLGGYDRGIDRETDKCNY